ncbi:MAG: RIP metalloprotease RseP, partial [Pseudomonadota bacterium]|nr:RIP metalloprotease RseP [Pseudomonadota bacterium]
AIDRQPATLAVRRANGVETSRTLALDRLPAGFDERRAIEAISLIPRYQLLAPIVGTIEEGSPAWGVIAEGDRITAIDSHPVASFEDIAPLLRTLGARGGPGMIEVERDGERLALEIVPQRRDNPDGTRSWRLGIGNALTQAPAHDAVLRYGPVAAVPAAIRATWHLARDSLGMLWRMVNGSASVRNVSGPITIARYANASAQMGAAWFLNFLALLSVSLAIINLMPIPVLDGGHLLYYLIELAIGRPLGERAMVAGQYLGLALLAGLMGLAFYNDILQLVS